MTFKELELGDRFHFLSDEREEARILPEIRIVFRTKVSDWHYENTHADGDTSEGRVGVGDNPVIKVIKEETRTGSGGSRTIGMKGHKGAPGSGSRPKGSVEKPPKKAAQP